MVWKLVRWWHSCITWGPSWTTASGQCLQGAHLINVVKIFEMKISRSTVHFLKLGHIMCVWCVCVCVCVWSVFVYMYTCICVCTCVYVLMFAPTILCISLVLYMYICVHVFTCNHTIINIHVRMCTWLWSTLCIGNWKWSINIAITICSYYPSLYTSFPLTCYTCTYTCTLYMYTHVRIII